MPHQPQPSPSVSPTPPNQKPPEVSLPAPPPAGGPVSPRASRGGSSFFKKNLKKLLVAGGVVLIILLVFLLWPRLSISPEPPDAKISLSGKVVLAGLPPEALAKGGRIFVLPYRAYSLKVEKEEFLPYEREFKLGLGQRLKVSAKLNPIPKSRLLATGVDGQLSLGPKGESVNYLGRDSQTILRVLLNPPFKELERPFALNLSPFPETKKLIFSSDQNFVIILQKNRAGVLDLRRRDVTSQTYVSFGGGISDIALSKDDKTIYYFFSDPKTGEKSLIKDNVQKTDPDRLFDQSSLPPSLLESPRVYLSPAGDKLLLSSGRAFLIDLKARAGRVLSQENPPSGALFSPEGGRLVLFSQEGEPWVYKTTGELEQKLPFKGASAPRFVFQDENRALILTDDRLLGYNFDSQEEIIYTTADIKPETIGEMVLGKEGKMLYLLAGENLFELTITEAVSKGAELP